jgi:hypothetical protein
MKQRVSSRAMKVFAGLVAIPLSAGCASKTQTGLLVGGAGGAAAGAAIGSASGNAGKGALIGGAIGLIGGGLVGHAADKSDEAEREKQARIDAERRSAARSGPAYASVEEGGYGNYAARGGGRVTREQVVQWTQAGVRDDIIVDRIERSDSVFRLSTADERSLRQQGVSEGVIVAMRNTARR